METATRSWTLGALAEILGGELDGPADLVIRRAADATSATSDSLAFADSDEYLGKLADSSVGAIIASTAAPAVQKPLIRVSKPREAFNRFLGLCDTDLPLESGIHPTAVVSTNAAVSASASIGPYAIVEAGARIGDRVRIFPFAYIGSDCQVGNDVVIYPHAVLYRDVQIGDRAVVHAHAVLGADGFGFTWNGEKHVKIPQVGRTIIGAEVEIGAGTTIDRAMVGGTVIGDGTKIDNQVQIGHNCVLGRHNVVASQTGISGSCQIGDQCTFAGQTGIADHVKIGNGVILTARAATAKDIAGPGAFRGAPALPYAEELRLEASWRRVPELLKRVRELESKLKKLEEKD